MYYSPREILAVYRSKCRNASDERYSGSPVRPVLAVNLSTLLHTHLRTAETQTSHHLAVRSPV